MITFNQTTPVVTDILSIKSGDVLSDIKLGPIGFDGWNRGGKSISVIQLSTENRYKMKVHYTMKFSVIGRYEKPSLKIADDSKKLKPNELFLLWKGGKHLPECLRFIEYSGTKICACNPLDETIKWKIGTGFTIVKLSNVK